jgi:hypothetical protein
VRHTHLWALGGAANEGERLLELVREYNRWDRTGVGASSKGMEREE